MKRQFTGTSGKIILHVIAWLILIILPQYLNRRYFGNNNPLTWWFYVNTATYLVIFYINYLILIPRFYFRGNIWRYLLSAALLLVIVFFASEFTNDRLFKRYKNQRMMVLHDSTMKDSVGYLRILPDEDFRKSDKELENTQNSDALSPGQRSEDVFSHNDHSSDTVFFRQNPLDTSKRSTWENSGGYKSQNEESGARGRPRNDLERFRPFFIPYQVYNYFISALFFTFFSLGLRVMERHAGIEKRQKELEKEKLNSELALLKNQISPHFFFNTLNNIYSLISINTKDSQNAVLKLSKLMRYLLYESEQGLTNLGSEIDFMKNYIDLMRLRTSHKVKLTVSFPELKENIALPPLLFIPFIENAFKHGISYKEISFINIIMSIDDEYLRFKCENSIVNDITEKEDNHNGIGLENVRKRLKLLFPGKHSLKIDTTEKVFTVNLSIKLKELGKDKNNIS